MNHLHFQLIYIEELFKSGRLPIELSKKKEVLRSNLQNRNEEINMVKIKEIFINL